MIIQDAKPSNEQVEYMEGMGFKLMKTTQESSKVTWVLPIGDPFGYVDGKDYAITINIYQSEIPDAKKLLIMIGKNAYKFGWDTKMNQIKEALEIPSSDRFTVDI